MIVTRFLVLDYLPFRRAESNVFRRFVLDLVGLQNMYCWRLTFPSAKVVARKMQVMFIQQRDRIKKELERARYVVTTADIWSAWARSFVGVTAHWFDEETMQRKHAVLSFR